TSLFTEQLGPSRDRGRLRACARPVMRCAAREDAGIPPRPIVSLSSRRRKGNGESLGQGLRVLYSPVNFRVPQVTSERRARLPGHVGGSGTSARTRPSGPTERLLSGPTKRLRDSPTE